MDYQWQLNQYMSPIVWFQTWSRKSPTIWGIT